MLCRLIDELNIKFVFFVEKVCIMIYTVFIQSRQTGKVIFIYMSINRSRNSG